MYTIMHIVHNDRKKSLPLKGNDCANCSIHVMGVTQLLKTTSGGEMAQRENACDTGVRTGLLDT